MRLAVTVVAVAAALSFTAASDAQVPSRIADRPDPGPAFASSPVYDVATNGRRTVIGGPFTSAGPLTVGGAVVSPTSGALRYAPAGLGTQTSAVAAPDGGWYVGGYGVVRRITPDGEIDPRFRLDFGSDPETSRAVHALVLSPDGTRLYAVGEVGVWEASATTGELTSWRPDESTYWDVRAWGATLSADGGRLFVAGAFSDGTRLHAVVAIDTDTGEIAAVGPVGSARDIEIARDGSAVYVAGEGEGFADYGVAALETDDLAVRWSTPASFRVWDIVAGTSYVFASGEFGWIGGVERPVLARLDASTGTTTDWVPSRLGHAQALSSDERTLYAGAEGANHPEGRNGGFAIDTETGQERTWAPGWVGEGHIHQITPSADGEALWLGGGFTSVSGRVRWRLAQMDETGAATWWQPSFDHHPYSLEIHDVAIGPDGTTYYAYAWEYDLAPPGIAAVAPDGSRRWVVEPATPPSTLLLSTDGDTLYTNGSLEGFDGEGGRLAAFDAKDGSARAWSPHISSVPGALAASPAGDVVYLGGGFHAVNGQRRRGFAAVDAASGALLPPAADVDGDVRVLAPSPDGGRIYLGGDFDTVAGAERENLAAIRTIDGSPTGFDAPANRSVDAIAVSPDGTLVVVGGDFTDIGYQDRQFIAAFGADGELTDWAPRAENDWSGPGQRHWVEEVVFSPDGRKLHVAGAVTSWGSGTDTRTPRPHYARFSVGPMPAPTPPLNQHVPAIVGRPAPGEWIECDPGHWLGDPTRYSYAWQRDGEPMPGEDGRAMLVGDTLLAHSVSCRVTASDGVGASTAESAGAVVREDAGPEPYPPPSWAEPVDPEPSPTPDPTVEPTPAPTVEPTREPTLERQPFGDDPRTVLSPKPIAPLPPRLHIARVRLGDLLRSGTRIQLTSDRAGRYVMRLKARGRARPLARRVVSIAPGTTVTVRLRPTIGARRWLRKAKRPHVRVVSRAVSGGPIGRSRFIALRR